MTIGNRRQLRPDKNIKCLVESFECLIRQIQKDEELENIQIKQKVILEQKKLKEQKDKQKRFVMNEFRRKYAETQEEKQDRLKKEREEKTKQPRYQQTTESPLDTLMVASLFNQKQVDLAKPDVLLTIKLHPEQLLAGSLIVSRIQLMCSKSLTLIHIATLIAFKNDLKEDEWPNFEFYPCLDTTTLPERALEKVSVNGVLRPFRFNITLQSIQQMLETNDLQFVYKKKPLP